MKIIFLTKISCVYVGRGASLSPFREIHSFSRKYGNIGGGGESTSQQVLDNEMQIRAGHDFAIMSMLSMLML